MSYTARELFYAGYQYAGMVELEQSGLNADQEEDARRMFNGMVDTWRADGYTVSHIKRELFQIVANQGDYNIGPGQQWDTDWPDRIERAGVVLTTQPSQGGGPPEYPMSMFTVDEYQLWILKGQATNFSWCAWYERQDPPAGIVHLLYVPTEADKVALYLEKPLSQIAIAGGTPPNYAAVPLIFQPAYQEALEANLARRILMRAPHRSRLDADAKAELRNLARTGMSLIRNANNRPLSRQTDLTPTRFVSNIFQGNRYLG